MKSQYYANLLEQAEADELTMGKESSNWTRRRTMSAAAAMLIAVAGWRSDFRPLYIVSLLMALVFSYCVVRHNALKRKINRARRKAAVLKRYLIRAEGEIEKLAADGAGPTASNDWFVDKDDTVASDLDLFGKGSLFQFLCAAGSDTGRTLLAERFKVPADRVDPLELREEQAAVCEVAREREFCVEFQAAALSLEKKDNLPTDREFITLVEEPRVTAAPWLIALSFLLPFVTLGALILLIAGLGGAVPIVVLSCGFAIQIGFNIIFRRLNQNALETVWHLGNKLSSLDEVVELVTGKVWREPLNRKLSNDLQGENSPIVAGQRMRKIGFAISLRRNEVLSLILNGFCMWDFHVARMFEKWKLTYGPSVRLWLRSVGEMEVRISLATIDQVRETTCWPTISDAPTPLFNAVNLQHPLIKEKEAVGNSLRFRDGIIIVTGSNMSGKTTLLRTVGINAALAFAGAPVAADRCELSVMRIFTSMRVSDDIGAGESTFYAELKRIREMIEYSRGRRPMLALIDEIFKGTNSADRIVGAEATLRHLNRPWSMALVSTHDFELCALEDDPEVKAQNFHFSEHYLDDQIRFDYLMREGRCKTTNARYLLRMAGILDN
ncbi:MAG: MutS family DNA mismatch repair protein [Fastidiosipilaceae bacterium]